MRTRHYIIKFLMLLSISLSIVIMIWSSEGKDVQLFDDIIELTEGDIMEVGIRFTFNIDENEKEVLDKILSKLNVEDIKKVEKTTDHGNNSLNFNSEKVNGTITNIKEGTNSSIVLSIIEKSKYNNVQELKNNIFESLNISSKNPKYSYHIKAKIPSNDISSINDKLISFLKDNGNTNIDSIKINNGFSTVAYTNLFEPIKNGNKRIDFSYAVVSYTSGNYLFLGTPILMIPY